MAGKKADDKDYWFDNGIDLKNRTIDMYVEELSIESSVPYLRGIKEMERLSPAPININLMTMGGDVYAGLALYDTISNSACVVNMVATGLVASIGTIIFLAADNRFATKNTTWMLHAASDAGVKGRLFEDIDSVEETKRINSIMLDIYTEKSKEKRSFFQRTLRYRDWHVTNEKMMELGMLHGVINK